MNGAAILTGRWYDFCFRLEKIQHRECEKWVCIPSLPSLLWCFVVYDHCMTIGQTKTQNLDGRKQSEHAEDEHDGRR